MPTEFLNILPDPNYNITSAGFQDLVANGAVAGQPFASIELTSLQPRELDRTHTGKAIRRTSKAHKWQVNIKYNPMTLAEFEPIKNFLMEKRGSLKPFYVSIPQYAISRDTGFAAFVDSNFIMAGTGIVANTSMEINAPISVWDSNTFTDIPAIGDLFVVDDPNRQLHKKIYKVAYIETFTDYDSVQPTTGSVRVHFTPGLAAGVTANSMVYFLNPLIQVVQVQDIQEYSINNSNLYTFSLRLKEASY